MKGDSFTNFEIENYFCIANATGTKLRSLSPHLLYKSMSEIYFLNMLLVKHTSERGSKKYGTNIRN